MTIATKKNVGDTVYVFHEQSLKIYSGKVDRIYTESYAGDAVNPSTITTIKRYIVSVPSLGSLTKEEDAIFDTAESVITTIKDNSGIA